MGSWQGGSSLRLLVFLNPVSGQPLQLLKHSEASPLGLSKKEARLPPMLEHPITSAICVWVLGGFLALDWKWYLGVLVALAFQVVCGSGATTQEERTRV